MVLLDISSSSDGEKDAVIGAFANFQRRKIVPRARLPLLPVTIRGEGAGRRMRGGASLGFYEIPPMFHPLPRSPNIT
ncbi:hypothetical protein EOA16_19795 [Mesorhizobium sp. M7A.F.Ca.US.008.03.1.1]|nr:hypothetical protein EOA16_19795 [Mesorhizobium sp. M7A.F.Ca.US.008.03.1.1]